MKKYIFIFCVAALWLSRGSTQAPWKFRSDNYLGFLNGEMGSYGQVQTVNGLYKRSWFLGVGAGLDYYRYRSIPLFLSVTKDLMPGKNGLFVNLDAGTNLPWYTRQLSGTEYTASKFYPAPYWAAGLGYKLKLSAHNDHAILFSAGYSYKEMKEDLTGSEGGACPLFDCGLPMLAPPSPERYEYRNHRASVKIGWQF
jgi:hypothetical protein